MPKFYRCGICNYYHSVDWNGDCREDASRFDMDALNASFGDWEEVDMPDTCPHGNH